MNTKRTILFSIFSLVSGLGLIAQTQIDGDLLLLSRLAIEKNPSIQSNALQIEQAEANFQSQRSVFDYQLSSGYNFSKNTYTLFDADPTRQYAAGNLESNSSDFSIGLQKKFRTGLVADISTNYTNTSNNYTLNDFGEVVVPNLSDNTTSATLALTQPLLKGNGLKVTTAYEKSAELDIESANLNFELNSAYEVSQLAIAYWQYLSAYKSLEIYKNNENRVRDVLEMTQELVKADRKPESDLLQIQADLVDQERQTTEAEQNLYTSRVNLGRAVGISEEESVIIGDPTSDFPIISQSNYSEEQGTSQFIKQARLKRPDIKALQNTSKGLELQLSAAKNNMLPQLDLTGYYTYGGAATGGGLEQYFNAFDNRQGRNNTVGLGVTFSLPINNNLAKANLSISKIALADQKITYDNLLRNIDMNVSVAVNNLHNRVLVLEKSKKTLEYYQKVFENEQTKFQNGLTTLLNLILFQERLTFAHLDYLTAQQQFAVAIINLRYETGTVVSIDGNTIVESISHETFYTIPNNN
ncbi:TolC family protein [Zobellia sp. B3R18]|uniref:TolC family protein n=1 Tax=Zobellia sp. B3R18 TaxID=2841568 RepID=UPI001C065EC2|nr:TolC family protein [Zobellia sp. B3R18]MBU2974982.1 TolC family protein [Zobellia sp. B3R18]